MIKIKIGNILDAEEDIICHQVNVQGYMGGGVARQLADKYKGLEEKYNKYCKDSNNEYSRLKGRVFKFYAKNKIIMNIFSQKPNFDTDYEAIKECFEFIKRSAKMTKRSIAIPYGIGCGIANGDWNTVYKIIEKVFSDYKITLYKLEAEYV